MIYLYRIIREPGPAFLVSDGRRTVLTYGAVDADGLEAWELIHGPIPAYEVVPGAWEYDAARADAANRTTDPDATRVQ